MILWLVSKVVWFVFKCFYICLGIVGWVSLVERKIVSLGEEKSVKKGRERYWI